MPIEPVDPCVEAADLRRVRRDLITGQAVSETRFGEDMVKFTRADLGRLDTLIAEADAQCAIQRGEKPKRRRYAMGARFRPY